jgi:uncharacterized membrane protein YedE/YeeE
MKDVLSLISGLIFGLGLIAGGMTDPSKVKGFLDIFGRWDPSLALVMAGAIAVGVFAFAAAKKRSVSWVGAPFEMPASTAVDRPLVIGGALFGIGWGLGGFCPGPAVVALGAGLPQAFVFVPSMLVGMWAYDRWQARRHVAVASSCG